MKIYQSLLVGTLVALLSGTAVYAEVTRQGAENPERAEAKAFRPVAPAITLTPRVHGGSAEEIFTTVGTRTLTPPARDRKNAPAERRQAASKGSAFYGFREYTSGYGDMGWMKVTLPTPSLIWKRIEYGQANGGGFVRDGKVYNFYRNSSGGYLTDAAVLISDFNTGETLGGTMFDVFSSDANLYAVWSAVYDETNDEAYVVTSNAAGNGYILQKFNPVTFEFTNLGVNVPEDWLAFAWHPGEGTVYMIDESCGIKKYDKGAKRFASTGSFSYDLTGYLCGMVYSPNDKAFLTFLDAYVSYDSYDDCTDVVLLTETGGLSYVTTSTDNDQWSILYCPDSYVNQDGPKAPVLRSFDIQGAATSGTLNITLPSAYENGTAISGRVYVSTQIDGEAYGSAQSGNAGAQLAISVSASEGVHRIAVTPYTLGDDGFNYGTPLIVNRFFGHDAPAAPTGVKLSDKSVTWNAVTQGANGGYINPSAVTYDVYIDGVKMTSSPVKTTSYSFTEMPKTGTVGHVAAVVAHENGKDSEEGRSDKFYTDDALSVPCFLGPDPGQKDMDPELIDMFTVVRDAYTDPEYHGWRYDDQAAQTGGFYCLYSSQTTDPERSDEWLFLPAINFDDAKGYYRFTMDLWCGDHYFSGDEDYEVTLTKTPSKRSPVVIREQSTVYNQPNWETSETLFQVPEAGVWYIGIHYVTNPQNKKIYRLYARNFNVEKTNATNSAPEAVSDLEAEASPRGVLSAVVSFKMPVVDLTGNSLDASKKIKATVSTAAGSVDVEGLPGASCTATVPAVQGENTVRVVTSSDKGTGKMAEVVVYCGVYRPGTVIADAIVSDDNATLTLDIDLEDYNENNEYVGPDQCEMVIYRKVGDEWRQVENIGEARSWTFSVDPSQTMDIYQFGVAARNAVGFSEEMTTLGVVLGKPYALPMLETWPGGGNLTYEPVTINHISYLPATWGFDDPTNWDPTAGNESGVALIAMWESVTEAWLPKFSTKGQTNVKADLSMFFGDKSPKRVTVYASSPSITMEPVATYTRTDGTGWEHKIVSLPASCQNQGWVELKIRCEIEGYSSYFMLDSYSIAQYPEEMVTITNMKSDTRATVGEKKTIEVELTNAGTSAVEIPAYTMKLTGPSGAIGEIQAVDAPASIPAAKAATLTFEYTPKVADQGTVTARFSIPDQGTDAAVTSAERSITVFSAPLPVVDDLAGTVDDNMDKVYLQWSEPMFTETFESFEPWDYSDNLRDFINVDKDGSKVWGFEEAVFPGKGLAKGFQVFSSTVTDNPILKAHSGDHMLLAMSTTSGETNDWLISPEVKGGSQLSFWMNILDANYPETIFVMYSTTGNATTDFKQLQGGYICPDATGWNKYSFKLPADARYFALWHFGDDGNEQFGCMIDDLSYEALSPKAVKESFNVYRDGVMVASGLATPGFTDNVDVTGPIRYYVTTSGTVNGEVAESSRSNVIWVNEESSEVERLDGETGASIYAAGGRIVFSGFADGAVARIYTLDGKTVAESVISGNPTAIAVPSGVYVVKCAGRIAKVIV